MSLNDMNRDGGDRFTLKVNIRNKIKVFSLVTDALATWVFPEK